MKTLDILLLGSITLTLGGLMMIQNPEIGILLSEIFPDHTTDYTTNLLSLTLTLLVVAFFALMLKRTLPCIISALHYIFDHVAEQTGMHPMIETKRSPKNAHNTTSDNTSTTMLTHGKGPVLEQVHTDRTDYP